MAEKSVAAGDKIKFTPTVTGIREFVVQEACGSGIGATLPGASGVPPGHWICITHDVGFRNNLETTAHTHDGEHLMAWWCSEHGPEVP